MHASHSSAVHLETLLEIIVSDTSFQVYLHENKINTIPWCLMCCLWGFLVCLLSTGSALRLANFSRGESYRFPATKQIQRSDVLFLLVGSGWKGMVIRTATKKSLFCG